MRSISLLAKFFSLTLIVVLASVSYGDSSEVELLDLYRSVSEEIESNPHGVPLLVRSEERDNRMHGEILGVIEYPFPGVADLLTQTRSWCDIGLLHLNTKACTFAHSEETRIMLFTGRKHYQTPNEAEPLRYVFSSFRQKGFLRALLSAETGPLGTSNYRIRAEAVPLDEGRTFLRFRYEHSYGLRARLAMQAYLLTLGRGKEGLSMHPGETTRPSRIDGFRGVIERNALRYFYAIMAILETSHLLEINRLEEASRVWFALTEQYPQLYEITKEEYLANKAKEIENSRTLQQQPGLP
jgi:hypothetical protein